MDYIDDEWVNVRKKWDFNWGVMDVLIGGKSSIDLESLRFKNWQDATEFLRYYGYDPDDASDARKIQSVLIESWNFIERYLIPKEWKKGRQPPPELLASSDVRDYIIAASDFRADASYKQAWACGVLRVMHTIAHIDGVQRFADLGIAREQIMARFRKFTFHDEEGNLRFGIPSQNIPLFKVEWKLQKPRDSVILKLLHKKANVAETIYDLIGVRIVTRELLDVPVAVKYLRDFHMVTFANCNPSRSKNSLIDMEVFKHNVQTLKVMLDDKRISLKEFNELLQGVTGPSDASGERKQNPHSSTAYKSIQLTCRQLIHFPRLTSLWRNKLSKYLETTEMDDEQRVMLDDISHILVQETDQRRKYIGFFPFEIQIVDQETYQKNQLGAASHDRYKQSQVRSARRRVLGKVLTYKKARKKDSEK